MIIYLIVFFIILSITKLSPQKTDNRSEQIVIFAMMIFVCFGYMTGSDWREYELIYYNIDEVLIYDNHHERLYLYINKLFKDFGVDFWWFHILSKCVCFVLSIYYLKKFSSNYYLWGLLLYFSVFSLNYYIDCPMRNLISCTIFLFSIKYIHEKKLLYFCLVIMIAFLFHNSAILMLPLYYLCRIELSNKKVYIFLVIFLLASLIASYVFREIINYIFSNLSFLQLRGAGYFIDENNLYYHGKSINFITIVVLLLRLLLFWQIVKNRKILSFSVYGNLLFNLSFAYIIIYIITFSLPMIGRLQMFLSIPFASCVTLLCLTSYKERIKNYSLIVFISFATMIGTITVSGSFKFIPYTNYLEYLFSEKPSYNERSNYNLINSPYFNK